MGELSKTECVYSGLNNSKYENREIEREQVKSQLWVNVRQQQNRDHILYVVIFGTDALIC